MIGIYLGIIYIERERKKGEKVDINVYNLIQIYYTIWFSRFYIIVCFNNK